jgi:hypothetical protein
MTKQIWQGEGSKKQATRRIFALGATGQRRVRGEPGGRPDTWPKKPVGAIVTFRVDAAQQMSVYLTTLAGLVGAADVTHCY